MTCTLGVPAAAATPELPPPIPHGRALAALAERPSVLLAVAPGLAAERLVAGQGGTLLSTELGVWEVGGGAAGRLVPELERLGLLRYAEPNYVRSTASHLDGGDPLVPRAWHLVRVGADTTEPPAGGVPITIVDTGLDVSHPDFAGRPGITLLNEQDPGLFGSNDYHGTIVASTLGAAANGVGTVGVFPTAELRVFDLPGLDDATIIRALDDVATGGVLNLSIGGPGYSRALYEGVMRAVDRGALVVAAAGNSFFAGNPDIYPADYPHVLTVAATDEADAPAFFSSGSEAVDVAAPGTDIPIQDPDDPDAYALLDGTSFSAPVVSGVAAWVWSVRADLDATQLFELLRTSARDVGRGGFDTRTGFGVVSIPAALAGAAPAPDPGEPNDDVTLIKAGSVLGSAKPPLTTAERTSATLHARLDAIEDPHDVYRVFVPAGKRVEIRVVSKGDVDVALWSARTRSVGGPKKDRLAVASKPQGQTEIIHWRNTSARGVVAYVDVIASGNRGGAPATYTLSIRAR
jgi:subtilisin family serine protease